MARPTHEQALEAVYTGRLRRRYGFVEVPTALFVEKVDVNMPTLPPLAFYKLDETTGKQELMKPADQPYSPLVLSLQDTVWIQEDDLQHLRRHSESMILRSSGGEGTIPPQKRMEILRRSALCVVEDLFQNPTPENMDRSKKVVGSLVYVIMKDPKAYLLLTKLSSHDPYTLQHSVGTAVNCIILARKMGYNTEQELLDVGLAGLLHDIGKVKVKKEIINKPGPLDEFEWEEMRQHSQEGYDIVKNNPDISERTKRAILEHHEDKNGTGYPGGLKDDQIDVFSKIVCICDIFNALTTNRSYSQARSAFDAFQFIREKMAHKIDEEIFKQLVLVYGGKTEEEKG